MHYQVQILGQRRNMVSGRLQKPHPKDARVLFQFSGNVESPSPTRVHSIKNFFNRNPSADDAKGKKKECRQKREALEVVDLPLGQATFASVF